MTAARKLRPMQRANAKALQLRAEERSGTVLVLDVPRAHLERIAACRGCGRAVELRDNPARLWAEGWHSHRDTARADWPRLWWCPECWTTPAPASVQRSEELGPELLRVAYKRRGLKARRKLELELRALAAVDPAAARRMLARLIYAAPRKALGRQWRRLAGELEHVLEAPPATSSSSSSSPARSTSSSSSDPWHPSHGELVHVALRTLTPEERARHKLAGEPPAPLRYDYCAACLYVDGTPEAVAPCTREGLGPHPLSRGAER